jgi:hypothetical protein
MEGMKGINSFSIPFITFIPVNFHRWPSTIPAAMILTIPSILFEYPQIE